jgi:hypothetical protein
MIKSWEMQNTGMKNARGFFFYIIVYLSVLVILVSLTAIFQKNIPAAVQQPGRSVSEAPGPQAADPKVSVTPEPSPQYDWERILGAIFEERNGILLNGNTEDLETMYVTEERNSLWAYELEIKRAKYLKDWAGRQGARFTGIKSNIVIKRVKKVGRGYAFYILVSTGYMYVYEDAPETENFFRIGTYHSLDLIPGNTEGAWIISREWYLDPFQDSLNHKAFEGDEVKQFVLSQPERDFSGISEFRKKAAEYADRWAGAASDGEYGYNYNHDYPNYSGRGGDCSNYVSQILHEGGFKTGGGWNYTSNTASRSWCNASGLAGYLIWSGRGYTIIKGTYSQVYQKAYKLIPGDVIAYQEKGKIVHMAFVVGADSKGYPLVDTHTTDRYHVPWDLGWNDSDIKFILIKMDYPS